VRADRPKAADLLASGFFLAASVVVAPDGIEYHKAIRVEASFPDDFGPSARKAGPGAYCSKCIVNGKVVANDSLNVLRSVKNVLGCALSDYDRWRASLTDEEFEMAKEPYSPFD
jgi:hypothetical protein